MRKQKIIKLVVSLLLIISIISCGGMGTLGDYGTYFPTSKRQLEKAIDSLYNQYPEYKIPAKWGKYNDWSTRGFDFLESRIFYFKSNPEEMYYVTFIGDSVTLLNPRKIAIGLRAVNYGSGKWVAEDSIDNKEEKRILNRFDTEIISKLERYTKTKSYKESLYK